MVEKILLAKANMDKLELAPSAKSEEESDDEELLDENEDDNE
jgi:hypothetical protein